MYFTLEDYIKILEWITKHSIKDTLFNDADIPLNDSDILTLVLNGLNTKILIRDFVEWLLFTLKIGGGSERNGVNFNYTSGTPSRLNFIRTTSITLPSATLYAGSRFDFEIVDNLLSLNIVINSLGGNIDLVHSYPSGSGGSTSFQLWENTHRFYIISDGTNWWTSATGLPPA